MITTIATLLSPWLFKWGVSSLDNAEQTARRIAWAFVLICIALLLFAVAIGYSNCKEQKTRDDFTEIRQEQSNASVAKDAVTIEAKEKEAETAKAKAEREAVMKKLEDARKSDSANEKADAWAALDRFCDVYKDDSACKK